MDTAYNLIFLSILCQVFPIHRGRLRAQWVTQWHWWTRQLLYADCLFLLHGGLFCIHYFHQQTNIFSDSHRTKYKKYLSIYTWHDWWVLAFWVWLPPPRDKLIWPGTRQERRHKENLRSTADRESPKRRSPFLDPLATRPDSSLTDRSRPFTYVSYGGQESTRYMGCQRSNEYLILQYDVPYSLLQPFMSWQGQVWHLTIDAMLTIVGSCEIRSLTW